MNEYFFQTEILQYTYFSLTRNTTFTGTREATLDFLVLCEKFAFTKCDAILHMRLQLMWIKSVLGNLLWPCSLIETSDTELSAIH